jgi:hypothetical protein
MQNNNQTTWISVSQQEAATHPLYGVKGWLWVYFAMTVVGLALTCGELYVLSHTPIPSTTIFGGAVLPSSAPFEVVKILCVVAVGINFYLAITKDSRFRVWASAYPVALAPISLLVINDEAPLAQVVEITVNAFIATSPWIVYVWRSRRVRVTLESKVRSDDPWLATQSTTSTDSADTPSRPPVSAATIEPTDEMYEAVAVEIEAGSQNKGLWLRCLDEAGGDAQKQVLLYTQARIRQLVEAEESNRTKTEPVPDWRPYRTMDWGRFRNGASSNEPADYTPPSFTQR